MAENCWSQVNCNTRFSKEKAGSRSRSQSYFIIGVILVLSQDPAVCSSYRGKDFEGVLEERSSQEEGPLIVTLILSSMRAYI